MAFLHGYSFELQAFPFLLTYLYIWGHSCPTSFISENSCNSWHHPWAFHWRKSLKQPPVLKQEITTVNAQQWNEHIKVQHAITKLLWMLVLMHLHNMDSLLQESRFVFVLHVGSKLDLSLDACELTGFIKGDRVGSIQYIIPSLKETWWGGGGTGQNDKGMRIIQNSPNRAP